MLDKKNFYINGKWVSPAEPRNQKVIDPSNEEPCAEISLGGKKDVDNAVSAAKQAFQTWAFSKKEETVSYVLTYLKFKNRKRKTKTHCLILQKLRISNNSIIQ